MLNNFIYAETKELFLNALNDNQILDEAIVFIEDTKEIWNRGHYFGGGTIDSNVLDPIQAEIATISAEKLDKSEAESTYATKEELEEIKWLVLESELITFTIENTEYQAEEGMTGGEGVNSKYNVDGYYWNNDKLISTNSGQFDVSNAHFISVSIDDVIGIQFLDGLAENRYDYYLD